MIWIPPRAVRSHELIHDWRDRDPRGRPARGYLAKATSHRFGSCVGGVVRGRITFWAPARLATPTPQPQRLAHRLRR